MSDDKRGDSRSGPCLTRQHDRCTYAPCPCTAPECPHANHVAAQAETGEMCDNGGSKTAPGVASTNTGSLAHSSGTSREGMAHMIATSDHHDTPVREVSCARQV